MDNKGFLRKVANEWNALPEEQKKPYNDAAKAETEVYKQELAKWELKMIRLGNLDLVRQAALVESEPKKSRGRGRGSASKSA